ncbi:alpha/beta fold hydrolase [Microbacterium gorillae]|uniref:alpha/beta fold hydrolase n=1 Tax=Microbacterium gorillae TaxID=1231063 RepID=UPI00058D43DD|nr:alpha/beta hydrolase [Microbacterium gorillae]
MDVILIPGLWLDGASWDAVLPVLRSFGHRPHPVTLPGVGASAAESSELGIADWIDAVVAEIDTFEEPVAVVGHSGGGNVAWAAAAQRPEKVAKVILVDSVPPHPGGAISEFEVVDGVIPFPGWDFFPDDDVADLDEATRERTAPLSLSVPARIPTDPIALASDARFGVPVRLLMGGMEPEEFDAQIDGWGPYGEEYRAIADAQVTKIGSGHWPQFSVPERLGELIARAIER